MTVSTIAFATLGSRASTALNSTANAIMAPATYTQCRIRFTANVSKARRVISAKVGCVSMSATTEAYAPTEIAHVTRGGMGWRVSGQSASKTVREGVSARTGSAHARRGTRVSSVRVASARMTAMATGSV